MIIIYFLCYIFNMKIIFTCLFALVSIIHLYASMKKDKKLRSISKVFILPFLILIYIFSVTDGIKAFFVAALIFSWLGDIFLIFKGHVFFAFGGIAFGLAHIFFMVSYAPYIHLNETGIIIMCIASLIYCLYIFFYFKDLKSFIPKPLFFPMVLYLISNAAMNCFALALFISNPNIITGIIYFGALLFFISDSNLFHVRFKTTENNQNHFIVMLSYIIAEYLIVLGMAII